MKRCDTCGGVSKCKDWCGMRILASPEVAKASLTKADIFRPINDNLGRMAGVFKRLADCISVKEWEEK